MFQSLNFDLLFVGITIASIAIFGVTVFFSNPKSTTNRSYLLFSFLTIFYGIANYVSYKIGVGEDYSLILLRIVIFSAVWHAFSLFLLIYSIPEENVSFSKKFKFFLLPIVTAISLLNLTPFAFTSLKSVGQVGKAPVANTGPGILLFLFIILFLIIGSIVILIKKRIKAKGAFKDQLRLMSEGIFITFTLLILFNVILPVVFNDTSYIPLAPIFIFPFIVFTAYPIIKHRLVNIRIIGIAFLTFALTIVTFIEIVFSNTPATLIFRIVVFILVLIFSLYLIRSFLNEIQQRERIEKLAGELEKSNNGLAVANERLKDLDKMKTEFISLATHQIRGPLTAIKGYISLIQEGDYGPVSKEVLGAVDVVMNSTNNLVTIVGDFLDVSRIEQGRMKYDFTDFDLQELVNQVIVEFTPTVEKKGLKLNYTFAQDKAYMVHADRGKIKQVFGNILDNSIKYTPTGSINVNLDLKDAKKALISIKDTGVGIPPTTIPKLFNKFTRAENANDTNILGTGLGLYVAKQMIEAHHGRVWAESEGEDKGAQFYIELQTSDVKKEDVMANQKPREILIKTH